MKGDRKLILAQSLMKKKIEADLNLTTKQFREEYALLLSEAQHYEQQGTRVRVLGEGHCYVCQNFCCNHLTYMLHSIQQP